MKGAKTVMKNKTRVAIVTTLAIAAVIGGMWYFIKPAPTSEMAMTEVETPKPQEVKVEINENTEMPKEYEEIVDNETGEKVIAEIQENEPIGEKPTTPPAKPKSDGNYNDQSKPPEYKQEQTHIEEEPKTESKQEMKQNTPSNGDYEYVEGFGYVKKGGATKVIVGESTGDINKMVGSME